ncbi:hypothetical protein PCASD_02050 [Puccinia coronata f. sp. avenae]|uniref:Uncharacterized protein n=1 Tax=Puccinia coronata f. sp. avenae TaxID=200324 RepID=A0A2N5VQ65_9BASI|nr:hypothetical protein PCASD_02050 [Puccinia coronata f. sp. avenae]
MAPHSPSPLATATPSRQLTQIITPVKLDPKFICPDNNTWHLLAPRRKSTMNPSDSQSQTWTCKLSSEVEHISQKASNHVASQSSSSNQKKSWHTSTASTTVSKVTHKKPKKGVIPSENASNTHQPEDTKNFIDMSQDSDKENSKVSELKKARGKKKDEYDDVEDYFEEPVRAKREVSSLILLEYHVTLPTPCGW